MGQALGRWVTVAVLCWAVGAASAAAPSEARRQAAWAVYEEAAELLSAGQHEAALARGELALARVKEAFGDKHPAVGVCLHLLGYLHGQRGELAQAEALLQRALELLEATPGRHQSMVGDVLYALGSLHINQEQYARAQPLLERAVARDEQTVGKSHPRTALSLRRLARCYAAQQSYHRAEPLFERAIAILEAAPDKSDGELTEALNELAILHATQGSYTRAEPLFERVLSLREQALGGSHPAVADALMNLARNFTEQGQHARAEPHLERALALREAVLGKDHPSVAESLGQLAQSLAMRGLYARAELLLGRALAQREAALGKSHPLIAGPLGDLAALFEMQGLYTRAQPLLERGLALREAALGKSDPLVGDSLLLLANCLSDQGLYAQAAPLLERALTLRREAMGERHPLVADVLHSQAGLSADQGLFSRAELLYQRVLAIRMSFLDKNDPILARTLNDLAILYRQQGALAKAADLYQRALTLHEAASGAHHPQVAQTLGNLANLYSSVGNHKQAEPLYLRSLAILEAALGGNHPEVAQTLSNLAGFYGAQRLYKRAEPLCQRALAIYEATLGKDHPLVSDVLVHLANLSFDQGLYAGAEPLLARALIIRQTANGEHHPSVALILERQALLRLAQKRLAEAVPLFTRSFSISERRLRLETLDFSEARMGSFLELLRTDEETLYSLARAHPGDAGVRQLALSAALVLKGRSVAEMADTWRTVYRSLSPEDRNVFEQLRGLRTQVATLALQGSGSLTPADDARRLAELEAQGNSLEVSLARGSAPLRALSTLPPAEEIVQRVAAALPKGGALVEFMAYQDQPLIPRPGPPPAKGPATLRYLALVLFPDGTTRAVDLGPAEPMDRAALGLRNALANRDASFQSAAQRLYRLAFAPLVPLLGDTRRLFLSTDGQLGLIPFAALHDGKDFLVDTYELSYLTSGRELLPRPGEKVSSSGVIVLADPDFSASAGSSVGAPGQAPELAERSASLERFFSTVRAEVAERPWVPLPGTRKEAEAISRLLPQAQLFLGPEATKERLLRVASPQVLHLATHGFFLEDAPAPAGSRAVGSFGALGTDASAQPPGDPMLRSGVVLAGARAPRGSGAARPRTESTLVTALELAGLDLWGTELVVLSACDTGRGEVKLGQGVYGLRRAFVVAGAETVVMSLWKVNDDTTGRLMEAYYRNLLAGQGRAEALLQAMRALRQNHPHPHHWAPFITLGQDTPLSRLAPAATEPPKQ